MKKLLIITLLGMGSGIFASALPSKKQEKIYKEEIAFINTLPKDASDQELTDMYRAHLAKNWYQYDAEGNLMVDSEGKPLKKVVSSIDDELVYYEHLNTLLNIKKSFANFKQWLEGQVDGINFVRVLEPENGR